MSNNIYIVKSLAPWMMDELIAFAKITKFDLIFLRKQDAFYNEGIQVLEENGIAIYIQPFKLGNIIKKSITAIKFIIVNILNFRFNYNSAIGFKSIYWFIRLDLSHFSINSRIHSQFATQAALVALIIKKYFDNKPEYSFTFHAYDIYFNNKWFKLLVSECKNAFSISNYNINYVSQQYLNSDKIKLSRLGVFRDELSKTAFNKIENGKKFRLGLLSWFVEKIGIKYLLQAMLMLKENGYNDIKLTLAGDGPLKEGIINYINQNNLRDSIDYIGKIKGTQKQDFYNNIDVFVLPSISLLNDKDGIPVVLMEAIASSLPLVSTNVSGIPEICLNNFNGKLVKQKDMQGLYDAIIALYENKEERLEFSLNSFSLSNQYDIEVNSKSKLEQLNWI